MCPSFVNVLPLATYLAARMFYTPHNEMFCQMVLHNVLLYGAGGSYWFKNYDYIWVSKICKHNLEAVELLIFLFSLCLSISPIKFLFPVDIIYREQYCFCEKKLSIKNYFKVYDHKKGRGRSNCSKCRYMRPGCLLCGCCHLKLHYNQLPFAGVGLSWVSFPSSLLLSLNLVSSGGTGQRLNQRFTCSIPEPLPPPPKALRLVGTNSNFQHLEWLRPSFSVGTVGLNRASFPSWTIAKKAEVGFGFGATGMTLHSHAQVFTFPR